MNQFNLDVIEATVDEIRKEKHLSENKLNFLKDLWMENLLKLEHQEKESKKRPKSKYGSKRKKTKPSGTILKVFPRSTQLQGDKEDVSNTDGNKSSKNDEIAFSATTEDDHTENEKNKKAIAISSFNPNVDDEASDENMSSDEVISSDENMSSNEIISADENISSDEIISNDEVVEILDESDNSWVDLDLDFQDESDGASSSQDKSSQESLCSDDDITDDDDGDRDGDPFNCENVLVCQFDNLMRSKCKDSKFTKWRMKPKFGLLQLNKGETKVFREAHLQATWKD